MAVPMAVPAAISAAATIGSLFGKKKKTTIREPAEIGAARADLLKFGRTGRLGNFVAGEEYGGSFGATDPTDIESAGLGRLANFARSGRPGIFDQGTAALGDLLTGDRFDPYSPTGEFTPFMDTLNREIDKSQTNLKRGAAFGGNLFSDATVKGMGEIQQHGNTLAAGKLAEEYNRYLDRRMSAIPMAFEAAGREQAMELAPIQAAMQFGGLERELEDTDATRRLSDFYRQRSEMQLPINAMQSVLNSPSGGSVTLPGVNPWQNVGEVGLEQLIRGLFTNANRANIPGTA